MSFKFTKEGANLIAGQRLYLDKTQSEIVPEGDPRMAFLLAAVGQPIPAKWAAKLNVADAVPAEPRGVEPERRSRRPRTPELTR